ncbi:MAG TPA: DNA-binding domain-containing protein, partial [Thermoanaerobaculia bacterium]|nr:DNA-binding domain-containing protein [Thermoanaerobaculia bacterium]
MKATLPEVEGFVWDLLVAPEGVEKALQDFSSKGDPRVGKLEEWFQGDERLSAGGRLDIYANMYFFRLRDSLREDFPLTARVLGEDRFHNLVTDYLLVHPSTAPSLRWVGRALPEFLSSHPYGTRRPFLRDLAGLEWARGDAFQAEDVPPFDASVLAALPPERWNDLVLVPVPSLHLVRVSHEVALLFERLTELESKEDAEAALEAAVNDVAP